MKEIFKIDDTLSNKISYYHVIAFLVTLPFDRFYSELVLISFLLHELIHLKREKVRLRKPVMITGLLYLVTVIATVYSNDKEQAFKDLEKQLALILFPFIFTVTSLDVRKYRTQLMKVFSLTCIITILYLYVDAFRIILYNKLPLSSLMTTSFINHNFSLPIGLHATIFSMYVALCAAVCLYLFINSVKTAERLLYFSGLLILIAAIVQLSSRAVFISALVFITIVFPFLVLKGNRRWKFIIISCLASALFIAGITRIQSFNTRYIAGSKDDLTQASIKNNTLEPRMVRWHYALQLVKESPVIGHGTGSEVKLLKEKYFENRLYNSYLNELNAHNQYLSFLLKTGILGLMVYLYVLYFAIRRAVVARDIVFCAFLVIISVVSFSENILDVNKGLFFFSFFLLILY